MLKMSLPYRLVLIVAAAGLLAPVSAGAQITKSGPGYLFRIKHQKGVKLAYRMVSETPNPVNSFDPKRLEFPFTMTTLAVAAGVATVKIDSGPFQHDGKPLDRKTSVEVKMDNRGSVVEGRAGQLAGVALPQKPLKVGESYAATVSTPMGAKTLTVKSKYTFAGFKQINGKRAAEIRVQVEASGLAPAKGTGTRYLDVTDGQLILAKLDQVAKTVQHGREVTISNKMSITRQ